MSRFRKALTAVLKTAIPCTKWTVIDREPPELVIWRMWFGHSYNIVSLGGTWGRWDRARIHNELLQLNDLGEAL